MNFLVMVGKTVKVQGLRTRLYDNVQAHIMMQANMELFMIQSCGIQKLLLINLLWR